MFVEALNARAENAVRTRLAALTVTVFICLAGVLGGYWYVNFYAPEKAIILKEPWPWAHDFFLETKEHLFFIPLILALYLPIVARNRLFASKVARNIVLAVAALVVVSSISVWGAGAIINYGVKVAYIHTGVKGTE